MQFAVKLLKQYPKKSPRQGKLCRMSSAPPPPASLGPGERDKAFKSEAFL